MDFFVIIYSPAFSTTSSASSWLFATERILLRTSLIALVRI